MKKILSVCLCALLLTMSLLLASCGEAPLKSVSVTVDDTTGAYAHTISAKTSGKTVQDVLVGMGLISVIETKIPSMEEGGEATVAVTYLITAEKTVVEALSVTVNGAPCGLEEEIADGAVITLAVGE